MAEQFDITDFKNIGNAVSREKKEKTIKLMRQVAIQLKKLHSTTEIGKTLGISASRVSLYRQELIRASKNGFKTIEEYIRAGRPLSTGKLVIPTEDGKTSKRK